MKFFKKKCKHSVYFEHYADVEVPGTNRFITMGFRLCLLCKKAEAALLNAEKQNLDWLKKLTMEKINEV